jgi:putative ABC transport system permease protein
MTARTVPLARRNLLSEPRRLVASAAGVGLALMLILLLDGLWAGIDTKTTVYEDHTGADLYVAAPGTKNFFSTNSVIPISTVDEVRADPDVTWAAPVRGLFSITQLHDSKVPTYLIGWVPGQVGGPWDLAQGRAPAADDEIAVGEALVSRHGVGIGDHVDILGRTFTVTGIAAGADMFMASFIFMTHAATDQILHAPDTTSFVLIGTHNPGAVRQRLATHDLAILSRDELKTNDLAVMTRAFAVPMKVMVGVAFAVGVLVIALTAYSAVVDHRRDYGIVKALGATGLRLYRIALEQTLILAVLGLAAGAVFFLGGRELIGWVRPQFAIVVTVTIVVRAVVAALVMGVMAAVIPARRLTRLDPATAYRGG